jgi:predicted permease
MEQDMAAELRDHMDRYADDLIAQGVPPQEARRRARVEFGAVEAHKEECRDALGLRLLDELRADIRYGFRMLKQAPAFTAVAILSLALGIGANTAIFTLMETALWKSIPVKQPEQLRLLSWVSGHNSVVESSWGNWDDQNGVTTSTSFSYPVYQALHKQKVFANVFAFKPVGRLTALIGGQAELVTADLISGDFYTGVGVSPIAGRPIVEADDTATSEATVAVISFGYWNRRFGRDASAVGKQIMLNQVPVTIVGVNPPAFTGVQPGEDPDFYLPLNAQPAVLPNQYSTRRSLLDDPNYWWVLIMGRLRPDVPEAQAQAALDVVTLQTVRSTLPDKVKNDQPHVRLLTGSRGLDDLHGQFGKPLYVLVALAGLVLLIACANLANLLLARATTRQREISVRLALGAGRWRITRQMLTEGLMLALIGGAAGVATGYWARNALPSVLRPEWEPQQLQGDFDWRVICVSLALALLTGILFSLAPAWHGSRTEVNVALKDGSRSTMSLPKLLASKSLVVFQVCLSVLLLIGAGLFIRTLSNLQSAELGFHPERLLLFNVDPPRTRYAGERRINLFRTIEERIAAIPGVQSSTLSSVPLIANSVATTQVTPAGRKPGVEDRTWVNEVGDRFFETMGIPIVYGRAIGSQDRLGGLKVTVVNQTLARRLYPNQNALGKMITSSDTLYQIVGICADAHYNSVRSQVPPTFYLPYQQRKEVNEMTFEIKTAASVASIAGAVRPTIAGVDKDLPVFDIRTQTQQIDATLSHERVFAALTAGFGILALLLACVGIYGVMAYGVARRTSEIGLRMALGAHSRQVLMMIMRETSLLAGIGVVLGVVVAAGVTRFIESMLFGLKASDPATMGEAVVVMIAVALLAGWLPARRAARLDPMTALRHE